MTGKQVTQTIPRAFLNTADELVLVDMPAESSTAATSALREMALLLSADVIDSGLQRYLQEHGMESGWGTHELLLVCFTPRANASRMIASARRNADRFHCEILAVYVRQAHLSGEDCRALDAALAQAGAAGARVDVLEGEDPVAAIVDYAPLMVSLRSSSDTV